MKAITTKKAPLPVPKRHHPGHHPKPKPKPAPQPKPKPMPTTTPAKKDKNHASKSQPVPAGVEEQIRHGGLPADDPARSPAPETVDIQERSKELQQADRERGDNQGNKDEPAQKEQNAPK